MSVNEPEFMHFQDEIFTGFFTNDDYKRIDLVLVIADRGSDVVEKMRINYLMNLIKFGLEMELDEGQLKKHRNLIFVKLHAPDEIIDEYGIYFNVRKFFKDSHLDHVERSSYPFCMKHERESIKMLREQYTTNYSTLERSKIVYSIIQRVPFGREEEHFGMTQLRGLNIIIDAFALHDGPYLKKSGSSKLNARQTLYYNWVGIQNIFRLQPIHMIQEYFGENVAMYFTYYGYFNFMLLFPGIFGFCTCLLNLILPLPELASDKSFYTFVFVAVCSTCRYFAICPFRWGVSYYKELRFIQHLDTASTEWYAMFISIWGIVFPVLWKRKQYYLTWMWEVKEKYVNEMVNPEYSSFRKFHKSPVTAMSIDKSRFNMNFEWVIIIFISAAAFGIWLFFLFIVSTRIWYVKFILDRIINVDYRDYFRDPSYESHFIAVQACLYYLLLIPSKFLATKLSFQKYIIGVLGPYKVSTALILYGFYFTGTFGLLTLQLLVGTIFFTHLLDMDGWYSLSGFKVMNNGLGTSLDDMCVTLAVAISIEQILVKIPSYVTNIRKGSEPDKIPVWEREYNLKVLEDDFYKEYNNIAMQFALATLFSMAFPLAPLVILIINMWDIRYKAKDLLLSHRRPLLLEAPGPAIWHSFIVFTSYLVPICNGFTIVYHSRRFLNNIFSVCPVYSMCTRLKFYYTPYNVTTAAFQHFKGLGSPAEELAHVSNWTTTCISSAYKHFDFVNEIEFVPTTYYLHTLSYRYIYFLVYIFVGILINVFIHITLPWRSHDTEEALNTEWRIKQKYYIEKGFWLKGQQ